MSNVPNTLKYRDSHEWVRKEEDGSYTVGITEHAQELLGDMGVAAIFFFAHPLVAVAVLQRIRHIAHWPFLLNKIY